MPVSDDDVVVASGSVKEVGMLASGCLGKEPIPVFCDDGFTNVPNEDKPASCCSLNRALMSETSDDAALTFDCRGEAEGGVGACGKSAASIT